MPIVPLGINAYERADGFVPEVRLVNMYTEKDESGLSPDGTMRIQRPGLARQATFAGDVRAIDVRTATGAQIVVAGEKVYSDGGAKGDIGGAGVAPITSTAFTVAILGGVIPYLMDAAAVPLPMPDGRAVQDLDQVNGYVLLLCPNGRFYWLAPGETAVDALNFATAESSADGAVAIRRVGDEFWIFGAQSTEVWQPTGDADAPFQRSSGRLFERGCMERDTVRRFDNSLIWVGDDGIVYRGGAVPQAISTNAIAERIRKRTDRLSAWTFGIDGHRFYVLRIPGEGSFAFDALTGLWCEFASAGAREWRVHVGYEAGGETFAGSADSGDVWQLTPEVLTDDGATITRIATGTVPVSGRPPRNDSVSIGVGCSADCMVGLRWKDGQDGYPNYTEMLEARAPLDIASMNRLGSPDQPYRTFEIMITDPVRVRLSGMKVNEDWI